MVVRRRAPLARQLTNNALDGDAVALEIKGQATGEGHNTGFGHGVRGDARCGDTAVA
jgi:hypothetical protein